MVKQRVSVETSVDLRIAVSLHALTGLAAHRVSTLNNHVILNLGEDRGVVVTVTYTGIAGTGIHAVDHVPTAL